MINSSRSSLKNKTAPLLYYYLLSPPCRAVLLLAKALGVQLNLKVINILEGEQFSDEYLKSQLLRATTGMIRSGQSMFAAETEGNTDERAQTLNPQHTIPTLVDDGIVLTESRAILGYLVDKYAKDDSLYPKDTTKRALVNQKLYFDMELFGRFLIYFKPILFSGDPPDSADLEKIKESLGFLDQFLVGLSWSAGEDITIADYALIATVSNVQAPQGGRTQQTKPHGPLLWTSSTSTGCAPHTSTQLETSEKISVVACSAGRRLHRRLNHRGLQYVVLADAGEYDPPTSGYNIIDIREPRTGLCIPVGLIQFVRRGGGNLLRSRHPTTSARRRLLGTLRMKPHSFTRRLAQEFCLDLSHYPYVDVWFSKAKAVIRGYEEINVAGLSALKEKYEMRTEYILKQLVN
uniref:Glutathione S-transferase n=1 Tax=Timema tahoe TaxID=61484 RepID=A0A7R9IE98_9NEOP|nr:unnamed protein product [Timema tahoe]